jgi:sulfonate transport system substrate-binding protein
MQRRSFVIGSGALLGAPLISQAQTKKVPVRVGWNPFAGAAAITAVMQQQKLLEKSAEKYGYQADVTWTQFLAGPPATEAMVAGRLDFDFDVASAAMTSRIKNGVPFSIIGTHASHLSNAVMVRPGSPINDVSKLVGRTIGLPIGTSAHYTLAAIVAGVLGKTIQEADIKMVNMSPADAVKMPSGIDAAVVWVPIRYLGPSIGTSELLVDADGWTGKGHRTPGVRLPEVEKAWGWPEGFFVDRLYISGRDAFLKEHPDLVRAFLEARWNAQDIVARSVDQSIELANTFWKQPIDVARQSFLAYPENLNIRNAPVMLEADALALIKTSEFFAAAGLTDKALSWLQLRPYLDKSADIQRDVWRNRRSQPTLESLAAGFKGKPAQGEELRILGGAPIWTADQNWGARLYRPGPFSLK